MSRRRRRCCCSASGETAWRTAVRRLPARQRTVVILSQLAGYATRDVARTMGISEATVRVHLFQAVRSLRRMLGRESLARRGPDQPARNDSGNEYAMNTLLGGVRGRLRRGRHGAGHLPERRLLDLLDGVGEATDRAHVDSCPDCADRLGDLRAFLDGLRREAGAGCEAALSPPPVWPRDEDASGGEWRGRQAATAPGCCDSQHRARLGHAPAPPRTAIGGWARRRSWASSSG